ncbi:restriction endonuclease subunit S [Pseudomonas fulva]|uniref:restriction endonuclease subunit S n=1 Tax=Pseudomonas fulva TaxID=47880 RepID=UPI0004921F71|nr:restriction endonuclease subunit S [Pseudomonas fulva]
MSASPASWSLVKLGDISEFKYGKALPATVRDGGEFPVYGSNGIVGQHSRWLSVAPTIIIGRKGSVGEVCFSDKNCSPIDTTYYVDSFKCLEPKFCFYLLKTLRLGDLNKSTAIPGLNRQDAYNLEIGLPPLAEQTRIATKLDELLAQVDTLKARIDGIPALLKRFRQSVLAAAVSGRLTEEWRAKNGAKIDVEGSTAETSEEFAWPMVRLGDVALDFSYGSSAKSQPAGDIPVLRMGNIQGGRLVWDDLVFSSNPEEIKKYSLQVGDVLFNRTNSPELVGKTAMYKGEQPAIYAGYLIRVRCSERLTSDFLNYCLNSPQGKDYCWQVKTDGVSQSNINAKKLADFRFGLPSTEEQSEIVRYVDQLFSFAERLEARISDARIRIDRLTQSILAKAFRGDLVPQDPNDEPADMLLNRIKAQRAAAPKDKRGRRSTTEGKA